MGKDCKIETPLRRWRLDKGLTLQEVGDLAGLDTSTVCRVELGERQLRPLDRVRLARALGVRLAELFPSQEVLTR